MKRKNPSDSQLFNKILSNYPHISRRRSADHEFFSHLLIPSCQTCACACEQPESVQWGRESRWKQPWLPWSTLEDPAVACKVRERWWPLQRNYKFIRRWPLLKHIFYMYIDKIITYAKLDVVHTMALIPSILEKTQLSLRQRVCLNLLNFQLQHKNTTSSRALLTCEWNFLRSGGSCSVG